MEASPTLCDRSPPPCEIHMQIRRLIITTLALVSLAGCSTAAVPSQTPKTAIQHVVATPVPATATATSVASTPPSAPAIEVTRPKSSPAPPSASAPSSAPTATATPRPTATATPVPTAPPTATPTPIPTPTPTPTPPTCTQETTLNINTVSGSANFPYETCYLVTGHEEGNAGNPGEVDPVVCFNGQCIDGGPYPTGKDFDLSFANTGLTVTWNANANVGGTWAVVDIYYS